jgi:hypothetical protein
MRIGDEGLLALSNALANDMLIAELCLSNARVSSSGVCALASAMAGDSEDFGSGMLALTDLDLSCNLICDIGASALATAIYRSPRLRSISCAGNRIGKKGAVDITEAVLASSTVTFLRFAVVSLLFSDLAFTISL